MDTEKTQRIFGNRQTVVYTTVVYTTIDCVWVRVIALIGTITTMGH